MRNPKHCTGLCLKEFQSMGMVVGFPGAQQQSSIRSEGDARDMGLILGSGRYPGGGHGGPLKYSCHENPMDRGARRLQFMGLWRAGHDWSKWAHTLRKGGQGNTTRALALCIAWEGVGARWEDDSGAVWGLMDFARE